MFRLSARADPAFLAEMLYEAVNWYDDGAEERPAMETVLADPRNARYVDELGPARRRRTVRARPARRARRRGVVPALPAAEPGYGYVADDVPELAIGVYPEFRRQRVGSLLVGALDRAPPVATTNGRSA